MDQVISIVRYLVIFTLFLVFIKPLAYFFGVFSGLIGSLLNLFSYFGASCSSISVVSGLLSTVILGGIIIKLYGVFHHSD